MPLHPEICLKDLSPAHARMALDVVRFMEGQGVSLGGGRLLVALSGGADSTALLVLFCALRSTLGVTLHAAHLDHALRAESAAEAEACRALCASLGVPFFLRREDVAERACEWQCGIEEAGRRARYAFLEECRLQCGADWVLTAHHVGDLAEDMLMRFTRGAGWPGLGGMRAVLDEPARAEGEHGAEAARRILRPLLMREKRELVEMLLGLGVQWQEDASNQSREWKRNRMRNDVLPLLLAENPSLYDNVRRLWRSACEDRRWWDERLSGALAERGEGTAREISIPAGVLVSLERAGRLRAWAEAVRRMDIGQARADTLESMEEVWLKRRFPRRFSFSGGVKAEIEASGVRFFWSPER
ncbi:MAG: tRNA lysidine(34) synthetase TilS [Mailhella sp.]|nr:tRNA lysidine(34) synthetase TilS [Mailhella sp.]